MLTAGIWLFVRAIALHNFPEWLRVGVSFGGNDMANGAATALGIGIQNVPEGLAVAVSHASVGYGRLFSFVAAFMTGLVEPVGGFLGISAVTASSAPRSEEQTSELRHQCVSRMPSAA